VLVEAQFLGEDRGPVDRPCIDMHKEFAIDHSVDHPEEATTTEDIG